MSVTADDIVRIATEVWRDVLAQELAPAAAGGAAELTGCIQITGAFRGAVVVVAPRAVAVGAAVAMFALDRAAVGEAEARDALGELTNMLGGHVKSMVAGPSQLALPAVAPGGAHGLQRCQLQLLAEQALAGPDGAFTVQVMEDVG